MVKMNSKFHWLIFEMKFLIINTKNKKLELIQRDKEIKASTGEVFFVAFLNTLNSISGTRRIAFVYRCTASHISPRCSSSTPSKKSVEA